MVFKFFQSGVKMQKANGGERLDTQGRQPARQKAGNGDIVEFSVGIG
jgi:hypothetical protein